MYAWRIESDSPVAGSRATSRGESTCTPVNMQACAPGAALADDAGDAAVVADVDGAPLGGVGHLAHDHGGAGVGCVVVTQRRGEIDVAHDLAVDHDERVAPAAR